MVSTGQRDMITILRVYKFKLSEPWAYCMARMPSNKKSGRLSRNRDSTERFCKYEQQKYDLNRFSVDFRFMIKLSL